ncbi:hypothetical protein BIWAKO_02443 [Bosea sp. BIWAKO-01]|nr:hypothetical protein BIWAKO_02443 [Bosea sp. BIWAKO-01]
MVNSPSTWMVVSSPSFPSSPRSACRSSEQATRKLGSGCALP